MTGIIVSCVLGLVAVLAFLITCNKKRSVPGVFTKMVASIFFIATAFFGVNHVISATADMAVIKYGLMVIMGLVFGLLGDIYLDQKWVYPKDDEKYLYAGFAVFAIGHFFYVGAMIMQAELGFVHMLIAIALAFVIAIVNALLEKPSKLDYGKFRPIVFLYSAVVGLTMTTAGVALVATYLAEGSIAACVPYIVFTLAGGLFLISDIILPGQYFGPRNTPVNFVLNHVTYYIAQYLIALTIILL